MGKLVVFNKAAWNNAKVDIHYAPSKRAREISVRAVPLPVPSWNIAVE
jgi:hypothetical protein